MDVHLPKAKTNYGYNSIKVIGAKIFNQLPEGMKKHIQKKNCISVRHPALLATSLSGLPTLSCNMNCPNNCTYYCIFNMKV